MVGGCGLGMTAEPEDVALEVVAADAQRGCGFVDVERDRVGAASHSAASRRFGLWPY